MKRLKLQYSGPRITESTMRQFETDLGSPLPSPYRRFLLLQNGGYPDRRLFPHPLDPAELFPVEMFLHLDATGATYTAKSSVDSLAWGMKRFTGLIPDGWLPIADVAPESVLSIRLKGRQKGQIDLNIWPELKTPSGQVNAKMAGAFDAFLEMLVEDVV